MGLWLTSFLPIHFHKCGGYYLNLSILILRVLFNCDGLLVYTTARLKSPPPPARG